MAVEWSGGVGGGVGERVTGGGKVCRCEGSGGCRWDWVRGRGDILCVPYCRCIGYFN